MSAYDPGGWSDLFVAVAGATAALSGLIFVGLSVNMHTVLELDEQAGSGLLTGRALEAIIALLDMLVISVVALTPGIARGVLAGFILLVALTSALAPTHAAIRSAGGLDLRTRLRLVLAGLLTLCLLAAGVTLAVGSGGGLDWLVAATVLAVAIAAINAWVLLVEVLR